MKAELLNRLVFSISFCRAAGTALMEMRNTNLPTKMVGDQLKSPADLASESLILSLIRSKYPKEPVLSEEKYSREKYFNPNNGNYWAVDPLDGTRSYHAGYEGFCVQVAYINDAKVELGIVYWPAKNITYWAIRGEGAYKIEGGRKKRLISTEGKSAKTYIDNKPATGKVLSVLTKLGYKRFLECGSFGIKFCKVAEGQANIFLKKSSYKIWDVAPGDLILSESGYTLTKWDGEEIIYNPKMVEGKNVVAGSLGLVKSVITEMNRSNNGD